MSSSEDYEDGGLVLVEEFGASDEDPPLELDCELCLLPLSIEHVGLSSLIGEASGRGAGLNRRQAAAVSILCCSHCFHSVCLDSVTGWQQRHSPHCPIFGGPAPDCAADQEERERAKQKQQEQQDLRDGDLLRRNRRKSSRRKKKKKKRAPDESRPNIAAAAPGAGDDEIQALDSAAVEIDDLKLKGVANETEKKKKRKKKKKKRRNILMNKLLLQSR